MPGSRPLRAVQERPVLWHVGEEGSQMLLGKQAGWFHGQGTASLATGSLCELKQMAYILHAMVFLSSKGKDITVLDCTVDTVKLNSWRSSCKPLCKPNEHWYVQQALTPPVCLHWRGKPREYILRLFGFVVDLLATESYT